MSERPPHAPGVRASAGPIAAAGGRGRGVDIFTDYPGAKGGAGVWQTIVNQIPPHEVWIEAFAGSGAVTRHKRPAAGGNLVIDADVEVVAAWRARFPGITAVCADAVDWLATTRFGVNPEHLVIYCDPPYLRAVRSCARDYYRHEFASEAEHRRLLAVLRTLPARVILSGYPSALYARELPGWRTVTFSTVNRRGRLATECLWLNFRERERIKRKKTRWQARLAGMPMLERAAILEAVAAVTAAAGDGGPGAGALEPGRPRRRRPSEPTMRDPIAAGGEPSSRPGAPRRDRSADPGEAAGAASAGILPPGTASPL